MSARTKENLHASKLDPATWIPRKEAARILKVSLPTILSWAGPRFRVTEVKTKARIRWFVHAADVFGDEDRCLTPCGVFRVSPVVVR